MRRKYLYKYIQIRQLNNSSFAFDVFHIICRSSFLFSLHLVNLLGFLLSTFVTLTNMQGFL